MISNEQQKRRWGIIGETDAPAKRREEGGGRKEEGRAGAPRWTMGEKHQMMLVSPSLMQCVSPGANTPWSCISRSRPLVGR